MLYLYGLRKSRRKGFGSSSASSRSPIGASGTVNGSQPLTTNATNSTAQSPFGSQSLAPTPFRSHVTLTDSQQNISYSPSLLASQNLALASSPSLPENSLSLEKGSSNVLTSASAVNGGGSATALATVAPGVSSGSGVAAQKKENGMEKKPSHLIKAQQPHPVRRAINRLTSFTM